MGLPITQFSYKNEHQGSILEKFIRRNGYSISELARRLNINRGVVYTWFNQQYLKKGVIQDIDKALNCDLSAEFRELFPEYFDIASIEKEAKASLGKDSDYWKSRYIVLLEEHKDLLMNSLNDKT